MQPNLQIASFSIINLSKSQVDRRLDAEYYDPIYLNKIETLIKKGAQTIKSVYDVTVFSGPFGSFFKSENYLKKGHPFVRISDIKDIFLDKQQMVFVSDNDFVKLKKYQLSLGDIVFSKIGTVGRLSIITEEIGKVAISENNIGLAFSTKSDEINKAYIAFFLLSDYGQKQIFRVASGNVQLKLNVSDIENILIPEASEVLKKQLTNTLDTLHSKLRFSIEKYNEAEQLLLADLNLADYKPSDYNISTRTLTDCLADDRFDAEYWQPKYDEIQKRVANVPQSTLNQLVNHKKGIEVGSEAYQDEGKYFIRVSDFSTFGIEDVEKKISEELYESLKKNYEPKKGEVLFTKDGTIGLSFALNEDIEGILSGAFLRLQPKVELNTNYLALVLNSPYCKAQIERMSGGAIIAHLKPESAMQISIPVLTKQRQIELSEMVIKSLQMRKEAKNLLEKAKRTVEIFVEQDEAQALAYLAS